jgi:hypothetical protein
MPLILSLHLILDASVSIIRACSDILREHPCLIDLVIGTMFLIDPSQTGAGPDKVIFDNLFSISSILEYMDVNELDGLRKIYPTHLFLETYYLQNY